MTDRSAARIVREGAVQSLTRRDIGGRERALSDTADGYYLVHDDDGVVACGRHIAVGFARYRLNPKSKAARAIKARSASERTHVIECEIEKPRAKCAGTTRSFSHAAPDYFITLRSVE